jgi:hypothetical protein
MHWTISLGAAAAALTTGFAAAGPAAAQPADGFRTPSGNIVCMASGPMAGQPAEVRCDILQMSNRPPPRPRSCQEDWGDAFVLNTTGPGRRICHGDTVNDPSLPVLGYRRSWTRYGITCVVQTSGVSCTNRSGRGISLARAGQGLY